MEDATDTEGNHEGNHMLCRVGDDRPAWHSRAAYTMAETTTLLASGPPATTETDTSTATLNDARGANSAEVLDVTAQAARSLPQFGSVVQAAAVDVASTLPAFPRPSTAPT